MRLGSTSMLGAALACALFGTVACKKSGAPQAEEAAVVDNASAARSAAAQSIIGTWKITSEALRDTSDMPEEEAEFVRAMAEQLRTEVEYRADGTATITSQIAEADPKSQNLTWEVTNVTRINYTLKLVPEGETQEQLITIEPMEDGSLRMQSGDSILLLVRKDAQ